MANADTPFGLRAVGHKLGLSKANIRAYAVPASYATAIFPGDPVTKTGTANTAEVTAPGAGVFPAGTIQEVNKSAVNTGKITGVVVGVAANPNGLHNRYLPASTGGVVFVNDDPETEYEVQADGAIGAAQIGLNGSLIFTNAGRPAVGASGVELDSGTTTAPATTAGLQVRILGIVNRPDNEAGSDFTKVLVKINASTETSGAGV